MFQVALTSLAGTQAGGLHIRPLAPQSGPVHILDLGCGTGIWCLEMAEYVVWLSVSFYIAASSDYNPLHRYYENARVIGLDWHRIQPTGFVLGS
jgi:ubiquinone/menaquinone biosynthesis C-methylase UbiE